MEIKDILKLEFGLKDTYVDNIINLLDEGCTIPFIARYRKEMHGSCDDQTLREFDDRLKYLRNLFKRKDEVYNLINEQGNMNPDIEKALKMAGTLTEIEDIYRPFKPKRKTRASVAIAKGLQPLADFILAQKGDDVSKKAEEFIDAEKEVNTVEEAIQGACDIVAETISDNANLRKFLRLLLLNRGEIKTKLVEAEGNFVYSTYEDFSSPLKKMPSHRILAINRGEKEKFLKVEIVLKEELALEKIEKEFKNLIHFPPPPLHLLEKGAQRAH